MTDAASEPLAVLQRLRGAPRRPAVRAGERCELCGEEIPSEHSHLVDARSRNLMCSCRGCYLLFTPDGAGGGHYLAVPDRYLRFSSELSAPQWESLQIPVSVAFFFVNSALGRMAAFYPGPAGATESLLPLDVWDELVVANPVLEGMLPDVEALLVRAAPDGAGTECYLVPIDACYELVGQLRLLWRGFDGGREAHDELESFFDGVRAKAREP